MNRSAPATGYDFPEKDLYRRQVWNFFRCVKDPRQTTALLMPSIEGLEIALALSKGYRERNLYVVDRNPAIVATLKRRFPRIHTYGVDLVRALDRMSNDGVVIDVANFDLTGPISAANVAPLIRVAQLRDVFPQSLIALTQLRGREQWAIAGSYTVDLWLESHRAINGWSSLPAGDQRRLSFTQHSVFAALRDEGIRDRLLDGRRAGSYRSTAGTQTLLWSIWFVGTSERLARPYYAELDLYQRWMREVLTDRLSGEELEAHVKAFHKVHAAPACDPAG